MTDQHALEPAQPEPARARLATLVAEVAERESELAKVKQDLLQLQSDYFGTVGTLYAQLDDLEGAVFDLEVQLGFRSPDDDGNVDQEDPTGDSGADTTLGCPSREAPSQDLKRVFRDLAKAIHPDRAGDDSARYRRHSMMAEANRAYAERDEDRLRLILQAWERSPESVIDDGPDGDRVRVARRVAELDERLLAIDGEFAELRRSAIWRLKTKLDHARAQGWDLLEEIVREVNRQISRATARLRVLRRQQAESEGSSDRS